MLDSFKFFSFLYIANTTNGYGLPPSSIANNIVKNIYARCLCQSISISILSTIGPISLMPFSSQSNPFFPFHLSQKKPTSPCKVGVPGLCQSSSIPSFSFSPVSISNELNVWGVRVIWPNN
jgi:hypothetical protein